MIVIVGAMQQEIAAVATAVAREGGTLSGVRVHTAVTGVGKVMAAMTVQRLIDQLQPRAVLMVGVAGGLNPELEIGDVVAAADTVQHDLDATALGIPRGTVPFTSYRFIAASPRLLTYAVQVQLEGKTVSGRAVRLFSGRILTGDQFMSRSAQQQCSYLRGELAGDAVDMESAAVAQVCAVNKVPHLIVRVISDTADGQAKVDFQRFLPVAGERILNMVQPILARVASAEGAEQETPVIEC